MLPFCISFSVFLNVLHTIYANIVPKRNLLRWVCFLSNDLVDSDKMMYLCNQETMTPEQRHKNMAAIRSKDTKPELIVRRWLWGRGFRYRLNSPRLPGHPDLVLRKYRTCVFVNGCFWHGHEVGIDGDDLVSSACCKIPATNREFWVKKIMRNMDRDRQEQRQLAMMGWHCITVWECQLAPKRREQTLRSLAFTLNKIFLEDHTSVRPYCLTEESSVPMAAEQCPSE
jgi:DNA mismatch endonuclease (patch repair protein)